MHLIIKTTLGLLLLFGLTHSSFAEQVMIPDKVRADILKRHPAAMDIQVGGYETHFQRKLLEVSFKEEGKEELFLELFREDGNLFTNEMQLDDLGEAPPAVKETLKATFPNYTLKKSELIGNPNGIGEEYEIYLLESGINWKVSINDKGELKEKQQQ